MYPFYRPFPVILILYALCTVPPPLSWMWQAPLLMFRLVFRHWWKWTIGGAIHQPDWWAVYCLGIISALLSLGFIKFNLFLLQPRWFMRTAAIWDSWCDILAPLLVNEDRVLSCSILCIRIYLCEWIFLLSCYPDYNWWGMGIHTVDVLLSFLSAHSRATPILECRPFRFLPSAPCCWRLLNRNTCLVMWSRVRC